MTAWTEFLTHSGAHLDTDAQTPGAPRGIHFADPRTEARAVVAGTIAVPLLHLGLLHSNGADSATFLHNLLSNDVTGLSADGVQWSSLNTSKGRMLASLLLWPEESGHALVAAADLLPVLHKKLTMYVLRSRVKLIDGSADTALIGLAGADAAGILGRAGLPLPPAAMRQTLSKGQRVLRLSGDNFIVATPTGTAAECYAALLAAGAARAGTAAWQLAMIRAGLPQITAATQEEFVAQMLNYELIGGVSFKKGCYPGQEIVARTQYLGKLKRRTYRVAGSGDVLPAPNTDLYAPDFGEQSVGKLVNVASSPDSGFEALAVIRSSSVETGDVRLGTPDGARLKILDLPYPLPDSPPDPQP